MKCFHCDHYDKHTNICDVDRNEVLNPWDDSECDYLKEPPTVFQRITASPEVLTEKLVYRTIKIAVNRVTYSCWKSTITEEAYRTKAEAIAATVARLKEVANG
jgi:hypothetical protein